VKRLLVFLCACASPAGSMPNGGGSGDSRCTANGAMLSCTSQSTTIDGRTVTYQVPLGSAPAAGWPVVVFYQGSFIPGSHAFAATMGD